MTAIGSPRAAAAPRGSAESHAPQRRLTYSAMSIPLGFAGTGAAWTAAAHRFDLTPIVGEALFATSLILWLTTTVARTPVSPARWRELQHAFRHPLSGPFPAYVPIVALLLTTHYAPLLPTAVARTSALVWVTILTLMCGTLISFWLSGSLRLHQLHPGYALPVIAGPYIASATLTAVGYDGAGLLAIGAGTFCWLVFGTIIIARLIIGRPLAPQLTPTLSVLVTPPVTGALAWFAHTGGRIDAVQMLLLGVILLLLAAQVFLLPAFTRLPFGMSWWAFSFPAGALAGLGMRWDAALQTPASAAVAIAALTAASAILGSLTVATITHTIRRIATSSRIPRSRHDH